MTGGTPTCFRPDGCPSPLEEAIARLSPIERVALTIFCDSSTQWDAIAGMGGGARTGLRYSDVRVVAEAHGFELDSTLLDLVRTCEMKVLEYDSERAATSGVAG